MDWADALAAFELFEITLQVSSQGLWPSLSRQQQVSWKLLKDWWYSLYQDKNLSDAAKLAIEDAASVYTALEGERYALQDCLPQNQDRRLAVSFSSWATCGKVQTAVLQR
jgi:hypothetical protein